MKSIFLMLVVTFAFAGYAIGECVIADKKALEAFDHAWSVAGVPRRPRGHMRTN